MAVDADLDLNTLPLFLALVAAGSFTAAAEQLGCNKSKVSLGVKRLESHLGVALFTRTTRQVQLTQAGEQFLAGCAQLMDQLDELMSQVEADQHQLQGALRIAAPEDFAAQVVAPALVAFGEQHPQLQLELRTGDSVADMVREGIDLSLRLGWLKDSTLRASKLGQFEQWLVASPAYLKTHGTPKKPEDLADHAWITFTPLPAPLTWQFSKGKQTRQVKMHSRFRANTTAVTKQLLLAGAGLSVLTDSIAAPELASGQLVRVLPAWSLPRGGIYAVFPPGKHVPARVRGFVDFLKQRLAWAG
ncbi:LysR family transcriptional regulator [Alcanivorax sediminis]|uniref:LysR family transcriptional regulator n=1 Tax=Alcanivorax sediminis TaxID=2663008 RepID=A0A6N7LU63_9GAMM|nr:LysR family transcriptional regulator [Alcanivorax sediminis]MQX52545.1 LysR family transcriptional regulator [Alcanivorax sediminis]